MKVQPYAKFALLGGCHLLFMLWRLEISNDSLIASALDIDAVFTFFADAFISSFGEASLNTKSSTSVASRSDAPSCALVSSVHCLEDIKRDLKEP